MPRYSVGTPFRSAGAEDGAKGSDGEVTRAPSKGRHWNEQPPVSALPP